MAKAQDPGVRRQISVIPQGWFHYISTRDGQGAKLLVIFSNDQPTDIGLSEGFRDIPPEVLGLTFATDPSRFADLDRSIGYIAPVHAKKDGLPGPKARLQSRFAVGPPKPRGAAGSALVD